MVAVPAGCTIGGAALLGNYTYSDGARVGTVTKLSNKGLFCKTWEGELAMDNFSARGVGDGRTMSNTFEFSVKNPEIVAKLLEAQRSGERVEVKYDQTLFHWPCEQETDYEAIDVRPVAGTGAKTPFVAPQ